MNGLLYASAFLRPIDQAISRIDNAPIAEPLKLTLRVGLCALPAIFGSVVLPPIAPLFVMLTAALVYIAFGSVQERLFDLTARDRHWLICMPVHALYLIWAAYLWRFGSLTQISRTVGGVFIITAVALWPIYLGKKSYKKKERKIPFKAAYIFFTAMVLIQQILIISGGLFND
jgi:hypothetical protein